MVIGDFAGEQRPASVRLATCFLRRCVVALGAFTGTIRDRLLASAGGLILVAMLRSSTSPAILLQLGNDYAFFLFLIAKGRQAGPHLLGYLLFSLASAFIVMVGFAQMAALSGSTELASFGKSGPPATAALFLLAAGFLIKTAAIGVHVWLAGAYAEADDDFTAMLSAVVSKVGVVGLFIGTYLAIRSERAST